jgi:hypothetical protein
MLIVLGGRFAFLRVGGRREGQHGDSQSAERNAKQFRHGEKLR